MGGARATCGHVTDALRTQHVGTVPEEPVADPGIAVLAEHMVELHVEPFAVAFAQQHARGQTVPREDEREVAGSIGVELRLEARDVGGVRAQESTRNGESRGTTTAPRSRPPRANSRRRKNTLSNAIEAFVMTIGIDPISTP